MEDQTLELLSAYMDGELPPQQRLECERLLAENPALSRQLRIFRRLDQAASVPVPPPVEERLQARWAPVAQHTVEFSRRVANVLNRAAAGLKVPEIEPARFERVWAAVAARLAKIETAEFPAVPRVSAQRWQAVWAGVSQKTEIRMQPPAPASAKVLKPECRRTQRLGWYWATAAGMAAAVLLAVLVQRPESVPRHAVTALELPEVLDERYALHVNFVEGQDQPVLCFFLKEEASVN